MRRRDEHAVDTRWGWCCPRCEEDVPVIRDPHSQTFRWECQTNDCPAVGFGFSSRRRARLGLLEYREAFQRIYR